MHKLYLGVGEARPVERRKREPTGDGEDDGEGVSPSPQRERSVEGQCPLPRKFLIFLC